MGGVLTRLGVAVISMALCGSALAAGQAPAVAATGGRPVARIAGMARQDDAAAVKLSRTYLMYFDNLTYSETSDGSLTSMSVHKSGKVSGYMTVDPPLGGTGSLSGTLKGGKLKFSVDGGDYTGTVNGSTEQISGTYTYPGQNGVWRATPASKCEASGTCPPAKCHKPYDKPVSWDTQKAKSPIPEIADYVEPVNVVISGCSTVPLSDIEVALGKWSTVSDTATITFHTLRIRCISPEKADVAGHGYVRQDAAWRLRGCVGGNILSLPGLENHVRIWNQPSSERGSFGAWFITASYETACVSLHLKLFTFKSKDKHPTSAMELWHCVDGGPGSFFSDGYNRGAKDFADDVVTAAGNWGWDVSERKVTRSVSGDDTGEDGVKFNGTVYVLTVTK